MDGANHEPEGDGDAVRAFEALRGEVAAQRRALERMASLVAAQGQQPDQVAPDYSPTLVVIAQELRAVGTRLDGIEGHPALRLTPAAYATQMTTGVRQAQDESARSLTHAQGRFSDGLHELRGLIGSANSQFAQQRRELIAVVISAALGFALWWPLAFLTPWGGGHWLAATLIGGGRWEAGQTLMREADPVTWDRMVRLYKACPQDKTTELCEATMATPATALGQEGPKSGPPVMTTPRPLPRGGRIGQ